MLAKRRRQMRWASSTRVCNLDAAFDCFERAAREGGYLLSFLNVSPLFDSLRSHERFETLQRMVCLT